MSTAFRPARIEDLIAEGFRQFYVKREIKRTEKKPKRMPFQLRGKK